MFREVFLNLSFVNTFPSQQIPDKHKMNGDDHYILPFAVFCVKQVHVFTFIEMKSR